MQIYSFNLCFYKWCDDSSWEQHSKWKIVQIIRYIMWRIRGIHTKTHTHTHSIQFNVQGSVALYGACQLPMLNVYTTHYIFFWTVIYSTPSSHLQSTIATIMAQLKFQMWQKIKLCCHLENCFIEKRFFFGYEFNKK